MIGKLDDVTRRMNGEYVVTFRVTTDPRKELEKLNDVDLDIIAKKHRNKRSLDANAFCWALCSDIGKALHPPVPKEEIYVKSIKDLGRFYPVLVKETAVEEFQRRWRTKGEGWFAEKRSESKEHAGWYWVYAYYGSSTYDSKEMSILIDGLVQEAEDMDIQIPLGKKDIERLKEDWHAKATSINHPD